MRKPLLFLPLLLLCGCAREPSPVTAFALDRDGAAYRLTAEVVRQDDPEDTAAPSYIEAEGEDFPSMLHALESVLPGEMYLSHAQVLLLVAVELRLQAVVRGGAASELLRNDDEVYALSDLLDRSAEAGTLPDMPLSRVTEALLTDGTAILPSLSLDRFGQTAPAGTAVLAEGKLRCFLYGGSIGGERFG